MNKFTIKTLIFLFVIFIILLALSVYITPLLETITSQISVDISGQTYNGTISNVQQYEIDISGVTHTGIFDISGNNVFGQQQPPIVNQNFVMTGTSGGYGLSSFGGSLNDIYMPGGTAGSGGHHTSPLDFLMNFDPSSGMYTDISYNAGSMLPTSNDVSQTNFGVPEAEESQLGVLGVDYYKCMEGDHVPDLQNVEPIGTYFYIRNYGRETDDTRDDYFPTCRQMVAPCAQFDDLQTGLGSESRCLAFKSAAGRQLCSFTPAVVRTQTKSDGTTEQIVDNPSTCRQIDNLDPPYLVDAPNDSTDSTQTTSAGSTTT
uniref:Uncharacterized protein n=1 Tax=viral metagenome TaxID=1070528 RepID=A0A6C0BSX9_9ZZZZ